MNKTRIPGLSARSRSVAEHLLAEAGMRARIESAQILGIGSAGLNVRGNRDEDGTHHRLILDDGTSVIYREYATTSRASNHFLRKETEVIKTLRDEGVPAPVVLASVLSASTSERDPAAILLSDGGGEPLEETFRAIPTRERAPMWAEVGKQLRRLHSVEPSRLEILSHPYYERPWTHTIPYFKKSLSKVRKARPEFAETIAELMTLMKPLEQYLGRKPQRVCFGNGGYLPGMMMSRKEKGWECENWLSLGYYVWVRDPDRDVVSIEVHHREWTGDELPKSFFDAYGSRPDAISELFYGIAGAGQLSRGAAYDNPNSGTIRKGFGPPPYSTAVRQLHELPETVERLRLLLSKASLLLSGP
jgi:hypothetical protein